jgi:glutathione peroxidase-family protein
MADLQIRRQIIELFEDHELRVEENPTRIKLKVSINEDQAEDITTYNKLLENSTKINGSDIKWNFNGLNAMS